MTTKQAAKLKVGQGVFVAASPTQLYKLFIPQSHAKRMARRYCRVRLPHAGHPSLWVPDNSGAWFVPVNLLKLKKP